MTTKLAREDAQEWLESLQQVGEGWYRQLGLAVKVGAHKALKMERREFAQAIGQRMIDPREAIVELHSEGHSQNEIADILGVSRDRTVARILAEEGLVEWAPGTARRALETGHDAPIALAERDSDAPIALAERDSDADEVERLQAELTRVAADAERATANAAGDRKQHKDKVEKLNDKVEKYQKEWNDQVRKAREDAEAEFTEKERGIARKEAEAWADEQAQKIKAGLSHLIVNNVVSALAEAAEATRTLINDGAVTEQYLAEIEAAHVTFVNELNVARMSVQTG